LVGIQFRVATHDEGQKDTWSILKEVMALIGIGFIDARHTRERRAELRPRA
jgi:hypothetical protein